MRFEPTPLAGAYVVELSVIEDARGFFARSFCQDEFAALGMSTRITQCNVSFNARRGTLRGMHYQVAPHAEAKLVRCTRGAIWDVIVDLRDGSRSRLKWFGAELSAENRRALYVPEGFAHGFQTLVDETEVFYQMSESYYPECARGSLWNDPAFGIEWPLAEPIMSEKDRSYPRVTP